MSEDKIIILNVMSEEKVASFSKKKKIPFQCYVRGKNPFQCYRR